MPTTTKPRRRLFQFGLRTLFILVTIASIGFGWLGVKVRQVQKKREAVDLIWQRGGIAYYDYQYEPKVPLRGPEWLRKLVGDDFFGEVVAARFLGPQFTDADLANIRELKQLRMLDLSESQITDDGLENLRAFPNLTDLYLDVTQVTDAGLADLQGLTNLKELILSDTKITDAGVIHLQGLTNLRHLDLDGTQITDAGLVKLKALAKLESLYLKPYGMKVTDTGYEELQRALPRLRIYR